MGTNRVSQISQGFQRIRKLTTYEVVVLVVVCLPSTSTARPPQWRFLSKGERAPLCPKSALASEAKRTTPNILFIVTIAKRVIFVERL